MGAVAVIERGVGLDKTVRSFFHFFIFTLCCID
jgi:hypothetical protein